MNHHNLTEICNEFGRRMVDKNRNQAIELTHHLVKTMGWHSIGSPATIAMSVREHARQKGSIADELNLEVAAREVLSHALFNGQNHLGHNLVFDTTALGWFDEDETRAAAPGTPHDECELNDTVLVAINANARNRAEVMEVVLRAMIEADMVEKNPAIESWWIAEDDRNDGSDCDSAVFCHPGRQVEASQLLVRHGLTDQSLSMNPGN